MCYYADYDYDLSSDVLIFKYVTKDNIKHSLT